MANLLDDVKNIADELLGHASQLKSALDTAEQAVSASPEQAFVDAVVVALEAMGYTVTPPAKKIDVQDGNAQEQTPPADGSAQ